MSKLKLFLLGKFELLAQEGEPIEIRSDREQALFTYLAVESQQVHRREFLASLLWPEGTEEQARNSLRVNLHRLRKNLEGQDQQEDILLATRDSVQLNPKANVWIDVAFFHELVASVEDHDHDSLDDCERCLDALVEASALYQGGFLGGWTLFDSQAYNEWVLLKQEWLHRKALDALSLLSDSYFHRAQWERAETHARRQLELEPWREEAHRQLMKILAGRGERTAALAQYELCERSLVEELGVAPSSSTSDLYVSIRDGDLDLAADRSKPQKTMKAGGHQPESTPSLRTLSGKSWLRITLLTIAIILFSIYWSTPILRGLMDQNTDDQFQASTLAVYDDFDLSEFDGSFDDALWFEIGNPREVCPLSQMGGSLHISEAASLQECGNKLRIRKPLNVSGTELGDLQAQMNLLDSHNGGTVATVLSWITEFPDGAWITDCGIFADSGSVNASFVVSDVRLQAETGVSPLHLSSIPIRYNNWYSIRLHVEPNTMQLSCWVDGEEIGRFAPENLAELQSSPFIQEVNSWRLDAAVGAVLVDDIALGISK